VKDTLFETERLVVRNLRRDDLEAMLAIYGDADAMRWVGDGAVLSREDALRWLDVTERNVATRGYGMCALTLRGGGDIVGFCGLVHPDEQEQAEIKYALARAHWSCGYATEAVRGMLDWGARRFGLHHVIFTTAPENTASHQVLRKAGMTEDALRRDHDGSTTQLFDWQAATRRIFTYGTLKQGFRNFHANRGQRVPGEFITLQAYPLYVIGEFGLPWLVHEPGQGLRVKGQLFEVDDAALAQMDMLERIGDEGWYTRRAVDVQDAASGEVSVALAYFGSAARLHSDSVHHGPLDEYTEAHQALYRKHV
jgi:[ribosomal protein S5]-alanine N-acetyltransferase